MTKKDDNKKKFTEEEKKFFRDVLAATYISVGTLMASLSSLVSIKERVDLITSELEKTTPLMDTLHPDEDELSEPLLPMVDQQKAYQSRFYSLTDSEVITDLTALLESTDAEYFIYLQSEGLPVERYVGNIENGTNFEVAIPRESLEFVQETVREAAAELDLPIVPTVRITFNNPSENAFAAEDMTYIQLQGESFETRSKSGIRATIFHEIGHIAHIYHDEPIASILNGVETEFETLSYVLPDGAVKDAATGVRNAASQLSEKIADNAIGRDCENPGGFTDTGMGENIKYSDVEKFEADHWKELKAIRDLFAGTHPSNIQRVADIHAVYTGACTNTGVTPPERSR